MRTMMCFPHGRCPQPLDAALYIRNADMRKFVVLAIAVGLLAGCSSKDTPKQELSPVTPPPSVATNVVPPHHVVHGTDGLKAVQRALNAKGYHVVVDGKMGYATTHALALYQHDTGLVPAKGQLDDQTWSALGLSEGR